MVWVYFTTAQVAIWRAIFVSVILAVTQALLSAGVVGAP
jgi:hypothetical protein